MTAGTTVKVTTVDGLVDLKIPGGTQPGTTLVMSKRGVPRLGASNSRGDHQVKHHFRNATVQSLDQVNCTVFCSNGFYPIVFCCTWSVDSECHVGHRHCWRLFLSSSFAGSLDFWHMHVLLCRGLLFRRVLLLLQVHVRVEIPNKLSNDERKIVEELKEIQSQKPAKKKGFSLF